MSRIAKQPETDPKGSSQEIASLFQDMKAGKQLTDSQHAMLEKALNVAAEREPGMVAQVAFQQEIYSGPLPHYDQLNGYDEETRREIVGMAVKEQAHAHTMQITGLTGAIKKDERGQNYALIVAVVALVVAGWMAQFSPTAAAIIGGADLVALVGVFLAPRVLERNTKKTDEPTSTPSKKRPPSKGGAKR
ncbi:DUF2335 domain-containing protein [Pseudomonas sp. NFACC49-2]|uniref:DUF2335 domain-containing protein n=1 Tax=Pseudomonas sp. NFACC49-2 TaxID=1566222 RepID=UPI0011609431|nr:DUF2335 domain-containing protein [Pseudomonas sp. NFACC49-2]